MIDPALLRDAPDRVRRALIDKRMGDPDLLDRAIDADRARREALTELQQLQREQGEISSRIGPLMQAGKRDEAQPLITKSSRLKEQVKEMESGARRLEAAFKAMLLEIPNLPHESVPVGAGEEQNEVVAEIGEVPFFDFSPKPHWEIAEQHGLIDFERGAKVTGTGFPFYIGRGARLQRALIQFFLDRAVESGYTEIQPPLLVNPASATGTGQLPDKEGQMYEVGRDDLFLIPTAEVPLTNLLRGEILEAEALPRLLAAYTPCFRREAGSYGKDVRGLNRLHQFDKVELVRIVTPETSYDHLEQLREDAEALVQALELPYRRLVLSTGDMGLTQAKTYDLEVWSAGQDRWLEVSSVSNVEAYQARRANLRYRPEPEAKPTFVHTLNGSALALPRIMAALLENHQQASGSILIPEALHPYTGFDRIG